MASVSTPETIRRIDEQICRSDAAICRHIESLDALGRGAVSQDILQNLRTFVEHTMFKTELKHQIPQAEILKPNDAKCRPLPTKSMKAEQLLL
jgi:hypothetical protein